MFPPTIDLSPPRIPCVIVGARTIIDWTLHAQRIGDRKKPLAPKTRQRIKAGLERIGLRPEKSIVLDWMLPAPAQGAIFVACREEDEESFSLLQPLNDPDTALCTKIERDFLRTLLGGCSTPISALAEVEEGDVYFSGQLLSPDGVQNVTIEKILPVEIATEIGKTAADELLERGGQAIVDSIRINTP